MAFHVGQKVLCVRCLIHPNDPMPHINPVVGEIYTVATVFNVDGDTVVEIYEIPSPERDDFYPGFNAVCFRPVVERKKKTDISVFKEILDRESVDDFDLIDQFVDGLDAIKRANSR